MGRTWYRTYLRGKDEHEVTGTDDAGILYIGIPALLSRSTPPDCRGRFSNQPLRRASVRAYIAASLHCCISAEFTSPHRSARLVPALALSILRPCPCHVTKTAPGATWDVLMIILSTQKPSWRCIEAPSVACGSARCSPRMRYPCLQPGFVPCVCRPHLGAWAIFDRLPAPGTVPSMRLSAGEGKQRTWPLPSPTCSSCVVKPGWSSHAGHRSGIKILLVPHG